jgi:hypothetical protein
LIEWLLCLSINCSSFIFGASICITLPSIQPAIHGKLPLSRKIVDILTGLLGHVTIFENMWVKTALTTF